MNAIQKFIHHEASGGFFLLLAALVALACANSGLAPLYNHLLQKPVLLGINDGLMAIFFFLVGLEIKREIVEGELSSRSRALLPFLAAVGGMAVPTFIYWFINKDVPANLPGWAIPSATDIAFALGVLSLLGNRVPISLKILLMAIAVIDDLGAILIIALFYAHGLSIPPLLIAAAIVVFMLILNQKGFIRSAPYIALGVLLWVAVFKSGIHPTMAGVLTALFIPDGKKLEHQLHPWVVYFILPVFAFANAGVPFTGMGLHSFAEPLTLGIIAGLFLGKQIGVFGTLFLAIKSGLVPKPHGTNWGELYGISILCGIGFTMSLFIGGLAFTDLTQQAEIRLGVLAGSLLSAVAGYAILRFSNLDPHENE